MRLDAIADFAARHHGLVHKSAALDRGVSNSAWYRAIKSGLLEEVHPHVARVPGSVPTREQAIAAAVMALQPGAMASHRSAAYLIGIPRPEDDPVEVLVVDRRRSPRLDRVIVHRPRDDRDLNPILRNNVRTANILRTLCDLGAVDPRSVPAAVGHVVSLKLASLAALQRALTVHGRPGRHGVVALREALDEWSIDGKPPDSVLEPAMRRLLQRHGIGPWEFHAKLAGYEVDFWLVGTPVVLECDGWDYHARTRLQFERDTERRSELVAAGHVVVPFTYRMIIKQPAKVVHRIAGALARWRDAFRAS